MLRRRAIKLAALLLLASCTQAAKVEVPTSPTPRVVAVPSVVGVDEEEALIRIDAAGLTATISSAVDRAPAGSVILQTPQGGNLPLKGNVLLTISDGWPIVPLVFSESVSKAKAELRDAGFKVGEVKWRRDELNSLLTPGQVFDFDPPSGHSLAPNSVVNVIVAKPYSCTPGYSPCLKPHYTRDDFGPADYDCAGSESDGPYIVNKPVRIGGADIYDLDGNRNGVGCDAD